MKRATLSVMLMLGACGVSAKCPEESYVIAGRLSAGAGQDIAGARVTVTWKDATGGGSKATTSSQGGAYRLQFRSSTLSGDDDTHGDICKARLMSAEVTVDAPAYAIARRDVEIKDRAATADFMLQATGK
jgi:hypothetical protein